MKDIINLELPLKYGQKISGHICQGHVDTTGKVLSVKKIDKSYIFDFEINSKERKNIIEKASICINGISLTISKITKKGFQICFRETIWCRVGMQLSATMATELVTARVVAADTATAATKEVIEAAVEGVVAAIAGGVAAEVEDEETEVEAEAGLSTPSTNFSSMPYLQVKCQPL